MRVKKNYPVILSCGHRRWVDKGTDEDRLTQRDGVVRCVRCKDLKAAVDPVFAGSLPKGAKFRKGEPVVLLKDTYYERPFPRGSVGTVLQMSSVSHATFHGGGFDTVVRFGSYRAVLRDWELARICFRKGCGLPAVAERAVPGSEQPKPCCAKHNVNLADR